MKWEIIPEELPAGEVLAANFKKGTYGYKDKLVGRLYRSERDGSVSCDADSQIMENCTHYIEINKHDIEEEA